MTQIPKPPEGYRSWCELAIEVLDEAEIRKEHETHILGPMPPDLRAWPPERSHEVVRIDDIKRYAFEELRVCVLSLKIEELTAITQTHYGPLKQITEHVRGSIGGILFPKYYKNQITYGTNRH